MTALMVGFSDLLDGKWVPAVIILFLYLILSVSLGFGSSLNTLRIAPYTEKVQLGSHIQFLENADEKLSIDDVTSPEFSDLFIQSVTSSINFGTTQHTNWFRFSLAFTHMDQPHFKRLLYLGKQLDNYDELTLYWRGKGRDQRNEVSRWQSRTYGLHEAVRRGERDPIFIPLYMAAGHMQVLEVYLRIKTETAFFVEPVLYTTTSFLTFISKLKIFYGMYYGLALSMIIYNLFHYFFLRDKIRLIFIMYAVSLSIYFLFANELSGTIFPTQYLEFTKTGAQLFILLTFVFCISFAIVFLDAKKNMRIIYRLLQIIWMLSILLILLLPFLSYYAVMQVLPHLGVVTILLILTAGLFSWRAGYRPAKFFLFAWIFFLSGGLIYSLNFMGLFPYAFVGNNAAQAGSGFEMVLLSLAIADRVKFAFENLQNTRVKREEQLEQLSEQLIQTEEHERRRIAGKLHDSIGQALCAAKWEVQNVLSEVPQSILEKNKALEYLDFCVNETRGLTSELYPQILYQLGLEAAISALVKDYSERFNLMISAEFSKEKLDISEELQLLLYRVIAELLNNVVKHAHADSVKVCLNNRSSSVSISVADDGVGFVYSHEQNVGNDCFGLFSIQERVCRIGGEFYVSMNPSGGSRVTVDVPI